MSSAADVAAVVVAATLARFGRVDVLVNNAGIMITEDLDHTTEDDWDRTIDINLKGAYLCSKAVIAPMQMAQGKGCDRQHVVQLRALPPVGDAVHRVRRLQGRDERPDQGDGAGARARRSASTRSAPAGSGPT